MATFLKAYTCCFIVRIQEYKFFSGLSQYGNIKHENTASVIGVASVLRLAIFYRIIFLQAENNEMLLIRKNNQTGRHITLVSVVIKEEQ